MSETEDDLGTGEEIMRTRRLVMVFAVVGMVMGVMAPAWAGARDKSGVIDFTSGDPVRGHMSIARSADSVDVDAHLRNLNVGSHNLCLGGRT